ncbi:hypothetical protein GK047_02575 [Paenibacillus sp. SYP-B3998]|uniref:Uncharacterized protein n=1 Tax=Paenibacillus sp. SYP-B3998 TaxID=2678564 RepID=A0A6G3ZRY9_9BACL|nr:hypothetical protein [Paenibacillus sp. SYP-B3998]NEW04902.1 hypothetical protein [Paenibacillus sp. SYP-B3998]
MKKFNIVFGIFSLLFALAFYTVSIMWIGMSRFDASEAPPGDITDQAKTHLLISYPAYFLLILSVIYVAMLLPYRPFWNNKKNALAYYILLITSEGILMASALYYFLWFT